MTKFLHSRSLIIFLFLLWGSPSLTWGQSFFPHQATSITILDPETGDMIYQENSDTKLLPASTTKLFPSFALLEKLGPEATFKTELFISKPDKRGMTNLSLTTLGDPSFTTQDLKKLLSTLSAFKISSIGSITLVTTKTEGPSIGLGWTQDSLPMCYATPIDPFIIDHNCFTVLLDRQKKASLAPNTSISINIHDELHWILEDRNECIFEPELLGQTLSLKGCFPGERNALQFALPMTSERLRTLFDNQMKALNISWKGTLNIVSEKSDQMGQRIATHTSRPLQELVKHTLLTSDNLYAEFFLRQLALKANYPSSFKWGLKALSDQLNIKDLDLEDGSGTSHYNLVSSAQLAALLTRAYQNRDFFPLWLSFLPLAGKTGTLPPSLKNTNLDNKLFAKTGSLIRVNTIAGYFEHHPKHYWIVVIMTFGSESKSAFYRSIQSLLDNLNKK